MEQTNMRTALDPEILWLGVMNRDERLDGMFVYAVRSTGVYCRPSCPSRRPGREQVIFFSTPDAAEQGGFRACKRCDPHAQRAPRAELVQRMCNYIETHVDRTVTLTDLSRELNLSPYHLQRTLRQAVGLTPRQYAASRKLEVLKAHLKNGARVTSAQFEAGYGSSSRLYENANEQLGMTPSTYRAGGSGMNINYQVADSAIGRVLVATTERGVCAVSIGDDSSELVSGLHAEYPAATIHADTGDSGVWIRQIVDYLDGRKVQLEMPLDVAGTAFQWQVWQALRAIPFGSTRTYHEIATAIGNPNAARAVGHACATNPVALVIPCHRAVRAGGGLGGYRWGLDRKRKLLAQEALRQPFMTSNQAAKPV